MSALLEQHQRWKEARVRLGVKPTAPKPVVIPAKKVAMISEAALLAANDDCPLTEDMVREARRLQRRGLTLTEIAHKLGIKRELIVQLLYWDILPAQRGGKQPPAPMPVEPSNVALNSNWKAIIAEVCAKHKLTVPQVISAQRNHNIVLCRHEIMYRLSRETGMSLPAIGRRLLRDHTSVMHGIRKHIERLEEGEAE